MFVLIGEGSDVYQEVVGGCFEAHDFEDELSLFSSKASAKKHAEGCRLKQPHYGSFGEYRIFRAGSMLRRYSSYRIEDYSRATLPVFEDSL